MNTQSIEEIIKKFEGSRGGLISILEEIQAKYSYLPKKALEIVSQKTGKSLVDIYGVATFYKSFSLTPRGRHLVSVCLGTACHVQGGPRIAQEFEKRLGIKAGQTTKDREFSLETVNCLGACALGPIVVVDGHYFSSVKTSMVRTILEKAKNGLDKVEIDSDKSIFPVDVSCSKCNRSFLDEEIKLDGHPSVRVTVSFGRKHGRLNLSSLYGSPNIDTEFEIPDDTLVNFFCPNCHAELRGSISCFQCGAPMIPMAVKGGGIVQLCSRKGCKAHMLALGKQDDI